MRPIEYITEENFSQFGSLLTFPKTEGDSRFRVLREEKESPWRLAVFRVTIHQAERLECHPTSMETFEPLEGVGVLLVASPESPEDWRAFLLNQPVCLHKGVWHEVIALTEEAIYKITENLEVTSDFHTFSAPIKILADAADCNLKE